MWMVRCRMIKIILSLKVEEERIMWNHKGERLCKKRLHREGHSTVRVHKRHHNSRNSPNSCNSSNSDSRSLFGSSSQFMLCRSSKSLSSTNTNPKAMANPNNSTNHHHLDSSNNSSLNIHRISSTHYNRIQEWCKCNNSSSPNLSRTLISTSSNQTCKTFTMMRPWRRIWTSAASTRVKLAPST